MISSVSGTVTAVGATYAVVEVGGIGLKALCTPATAASLRLGKPAQLATSLVVREDSLTLYGFADTEERDCFELVQTATGVGPKLAQAIVSVLSPADLQQAISAQNLSALTKVPGVGRKGAERLVIELRDKIAGLGTVDAGTVPAQTAEPLWREQVRGGLEGLGYSTKDAEAACERVAAMADDDPQPNVAVLMRAALRTLAK